MKPEAWWVSIFVSLTSISRPPASPALCPVVAARQPLAVPSGGEGVSLGPLCGCGRAASPV